ncbi:hypothetical protein ABIB34_000492 [Rhodococcus sp. UYP5]
MLGLIGVGLDLIGYLVTIVINGIQLADPGIRFG